MRGRGQYVASVALMAAMATTLMLTVKFPLLPFASFLKYDPSDAVTLLAGLAWGPGAGVASVVLKDLLLWLIRDGNPLGPLADALAAGTFVGVSAAVARRNGAIQPAGGLWLGDAAGSARRLAGAILVGALARVAVMAVANFPILYLQFGMPPQRVAQLLLPAIVPFNALKSLLNGALSMVLLLALQRRRAVADLAR